MDAQLLVILVAPNVGEQIGGEAIKALQIFREIKKLHPNTLQITHARCRPEVSERLKLQDVYFIEETALSYAIWRSIILRSLQDVWFAKKAIKLAESIARERKLKNNQVIIHQTEPNSPVIPRFISSRHSNVFGPINGNIYYPDIFRGNESFSAWLRRRFHMPVQKVNRYFFRVKNRVDAVLYAGGDRTRKSLEAAGYAARTLFDSLDCGIPDNILDRVRINHTTTNMRFVHYGRLVFHKGTALAIEALKFTKFPVQLDIIGRGPELERCKSLVQKLGLQDRITFIDWFPSHDDLLNSLSNYRGIVLPSMEDANGIVVQEAMALGLPAICLDWGGPQLLVQNGESGFLVKPISRDHTLSGIATCMDSLSSNATLADNFSKAAREQAENWRWSKIARSWLTIYSRIGSAKYLSSEFSGRDNIRKEKMIS